MSRVCLQLEPPGQCSVMQELRHKYLVESVTTNKDEKFNLREKLEL
jgi:hypothetical protein